MSDAAQYAIITGAFLLVNRVWSSIEARGLTKKVDDIHKATNGMQAAMIASAKTEGHAAGVAEQKVIDKSGGTT